MRSLAANLRRLYRLEPRRRRRLLQALVVVLGVRLGIWLLPYLLLRKALNLTFQRSPKKAPSSLHSPEEIVWAVESAARCIPRATCLCRALAAEALLRREGHQASVRIGVTRSSGGAFQAHAWLEKEGRILLGDIPDLPQYTALLPADGNAAAPVERSENRG